MRPTFTPRDPDFAARVRKSFSAQAMMNTLGAEVTDLGPGWVEIEFPHDPAFTQQHGYMHAGAVATVLDSACGYSAFSLMPAGAAVLTTEYKVNLLRPARAKRYRANGQVVKAGRTLTVSQATAYGVGDEEPIALMTGTLMTIVGADIVD